MTYVDVTHTVTDILLHVKRQFGDEAAVQVTDEDIIRWINQGQTEIFNRIEPIKSTAQTDVQANEANYNFPEDLSRVQAIYVAGIPLKHLSTQEAEEYILSHDPESTVRALPEYWTEWGGTFTFYPVPSQSISGGITLKYIKKPNRIESVDSVLSVPDVYYNRLLEYVLQQAYELDENFQASQMKGEQFAVNLTAQQNKENSVPNTYPTITVLDEDL